MHVEAGGTKELWWHPLVERDALLSFVALERVGEAMRSPPRA